jgi:Fe-S cluster biosynthesis and repair protein YggX
VSRASEAFSNWLTDQVMSVLEQDLSKPEPADRKGESRDQHRRGNSETRNR